MSSYFSYALSKFFGKKPTKENENIISRSSPPITILQHLDRYLLNGTFFFPTIENGVQ